MTPMNLHMAAAAAAFAVAFFSASKTTVAGNETSLMLNCTPNETLSASRDPIVGITIDLTGQDWRVTYFAKSGNFYRRSDQYVIYDTSNSGHSWRGFLKASPYLMMAGELRRDGEHYIYVESLFDRRHGVAKVLENRVSCMAVVPRPRPTSIR